MTQDQSSNYEPECWVYRTEEKDGKIHFIKEPPNVKCINTNKINIRDDMKPSGVIHWFMPKFLIKK